MSNFDRLAKKINTQAGSPRKGQAYRTVKDSKGRDVHVYAKSGKRITMAKSPAPTRSSPAGTTMSSRGVSYGTRVNRAAGNPRAGSSYETIQRGGNTYHRYGAEAGGIPAEVFRVKRKK